MTPPAPSTTLAPGLLLHAPEGRLFALLLPVSLGTSGGPEAVGWLTPAPDTKQAPPGELWYFPNPGAPRLLTTLPSFVPRGPDCTLSPELEQTGPHSVTLDVSAQCSAAPLPRAPARAVVIASPGLERKLLLTLRLAAPAPGETLGVEVDSSDRDGDGRDDARVSIDVGQQNTTSLGADLVWLDRAAGASRDTGEPGRSLGRLAARVGARIRLRRPAHDGTDNPGNLIRLVSTLCAESGTPRVFDADGAALRCGDLSRVTDALSAAQVQEALLRSDTEQAFAALGRDGWYFGHAATAARKVLERDLRRSVTSLTPEREVALHARPELPRGPHYSPLWFEADGALLVRGAGGLVRVAPDGSQEEAIGAEGGPALWSLDVSSPSGTRLTGVAHACDRSELLLTLADSAGTPIAPAPLELLSARPASCDGRGTSPPTPLAPIGFDRDGLELLVAGSHVHVLGPERPADAPAALPSPGSPRSPDGRVRVAVTPLGLLISGDRKELWDVSALGRAPASLADCTVANAARAVACLSAGKALLYPRPAEPEKP